MQSGYGVSPSRGGKERPCPCGGRENCSRCWGTGYISTVVEPLAAVEGPMRGRPVKRAVANPPKPLVKGLPAYIRPALPPPMVQCPHCSALVGAKRLERHIQKVHASASPRAGAIREQLATRPMPKKTVPPKASVPVVKAKPATKQRTSIGADRATRTRPPENGRDGSEGFGQFREGGRFGSHPSFDDFGDESEP